MDDLLGAWVVAVCCLVWVALAARAGYFDDPPGPDAVPT